MKVLLRQHVAPQPSSCPKCLWPGRLALLAGLVCAVLLSGCSSFNRDWSRASRQIVPTNSMAGRWEGHWVSDVNAHKGALRCLITVESDSLCQARFRATYKSWLHFTYTVPLNVQKHFDGWEFDGEENLGALAGGVYYYEGRASLTNFYSSYRSKYDHGVFEMRRVP